MRKLVPPYTMSDSPNRISKQRQIRSGLYIYQTPRSPFWQAKVWLPRQKRYIAKSTKETDRLEAIDAAISFADKTLSTIGTVDPNPKATRFETYADKYDRHLKAVEGADSRKYKDYHSSLYRKEAGIIHYFGDMQLSKITTGTMRDYLVELDIQREEPLAGSSKKKLIMTARAVMRMALEDGIIDRIPDAPKIAARDNPRVAFTNSEYMDFMRAASRCIKRGDVVSGIRLSQHHIHIFRFIVHAFVRPTTNELFYLKHRDIQIKTDPTHLWMVIKKGKTGLRESFTMPFAVSIYKHICSRPSDLSGVAFREANMDEYVFMPEYRKRSYARTALSRIFLHIIREADLERDEDRLVMYSLRHYSLQKRVRDSKGKVPLSQLAKNAGTSVEMLERFYLKRMAPSSEIIAEFQRNG